MPNFNFDHSEKIITIDFTEAEYKVLGWQEQDPFEAIRKRVIEKVEYAWADAVREELRLNLQNPEVSTMSANEEELILSSSRETLKEKVDYLVSNDLISYPKEQDSEQPKPPASTS